MQLLIGHGQVPTIMPEASVFSRASNEFLSQLKREWGAEQ